MNLAYPYGMSFSTKPIILALSFLFCFGNILLAQQQGGNPFEMKFRLSEEEIKEMDVDSVINPFDVQARAASLSLVKKEKPSGKGLLQPLVKHDGDKDIPQSWLIYLLLPILFLAIIILSLFRDRVLQLFRLLFNSGFRNLAYRNSKGKSQPQEILLFVLTWFSYSALGFLFVRNTYIHQDNFLLSIISALGISFAFLSFKWFSISLVKYLFPQHKDMDYALFLFKQYNFALGLMMIPFCFLLAFAQENVTNVIVILLGMILGIWLLFRIISALQLMLKFFAANTFRFFAYFCTVEIAPVVILWVSLESILLL